MGHVERTEEMKNTYTILVGNLIERHIVGDLGIDAEK